MLIRSQIKGHSALLQFLVFRTITSSLFQDAKAMALNIDQRLQDLADNIQQSETLLKSFEDTLRLEDDPRRRMRYEHEIQRIKISIAQYRQEYQQLENTHITTTAASNSNVLDNTTAISDYVQRSRLSQFLVALPGPQFEQVMFILNPPLGNISPPTAPQASRAASLLHWAESPSGCGLPNVAMVLRAHFQFE